ncbi:hypothetical protein [Hungatella hathewayi]|uniref:hypothetical protein n=1 Tax=Hungatella hathewayi TaxID=154046 RepID=UPI00356492D9
MNLPFTLTPPISYTPAHSHFISTILQHSDGKNWLYDHYINIYLRINTENQLERLETQANYTDLSLSNRNYSPFLFYYFIPRNFIENIINDLKDIINEGYYIFLWLNHKYIQGSLNYGKKDYLHTALIHGYNDEEFIVSDYFNFKMETKQISYNEFIHAFVNVPLMMESPHYHFHQSELAIFKLNGKAHYNFSINLLKCSLIDYLEGKDTTARNYNETPWFDLWGSYRVYHGLSSLQYFPELFLHGLINQREAHLLVEWSNLMFLRLDFLIDNLYITKNISELKNTINNVNRTCRILEAKVIKSSITGTIESNINMIKDLCCQIAKGEENFIKLLLGSINS